MVRKSPNSIPDPACMAKCHTASHMKRPCTHAMAFLGKCSPEQVKTAACTTFKYQKVVGRARTHNKCLPRSCSHRRGVSLQNAAICTRHAYEAQIHFAERTPDPAQSTPHKTPVDKTQVTSPTPGNSGSCSDRLLRCTQGEHNTADPVWTGDALPGARCAARKGALAIPTPLVDGSCLAGRELRCAQGGHTNSLQKP